MRTKYFFLLILFVFLHQETFAQDKGFNFLLGPSVNLYYGDTNEKFAYATERLSWQFNGQLGYISTSGGTNRGNMLAIFGTVGSSKPEVVEILLATSDNLLGNIDAEKKFNEYYSLEGGMVIGQFLRLSGGIGGQYFTLETGEQGLLKYYSGTAGISLNLGVVNWVFDTNLLTGKNLTQNSLRFSTGFLIKF